MTSAGTRTQVFAPVVESINASIGGLTKAFAAENYTLYIVGGAVRDLWLGAGRDGDDIDLTTDATPDEILRIARPFAEAVWTQGQRFGTIGLVVADKTVEITTHRAEVYASESRKPGVVFGTSLREDLARRDFTINAVAVSLIDGSVHDPFSGLEDLDARLLRTPLSPEVSFGDDPLRIMRAARFISRFELSCTPELMAAARLRAERMTIVSAERVHAEFERLLDLDAPEPGLRFLFDTGIGAQIFPTLLADKEAAITLASSLASRLSRRAGFFSPLGENARAVLRDLKYSTADQHQTMDLIMGFVRANSYDGTDVSVRSLVSQVSLALMPELLDLLSAWTNTLASGGDAARFCQFAEHFERLAAIENLADMEVPLSGADIMTLLDIKPSRQVGAAMRYLRTQRLERGPLTSAEATELLLAWHSDRRER